ncbi:hypothetical protein HALLA_13400 [Halostagnicola larsenii XH-48]|uniref:Uncharacterized protein n=1 Tax=Halostagnicola larsenii XH-48 TaxID=797299 RepID=W0JQL9_9EURY|nr:hypothetical protein HALLA_13400 [Halostagnicola larsenii XH-48]
MIDDRVENAAPAFGQQPLRCGSGGDQFAPSRPRVDRRRRDAIDISSE